MLLSCTQNPVKELSISKIIRIWTLDKLTKVSQKSGSYQTQAIGSEKKFGWKWLASSDFLLLSFKQQNLVILIVYMFYLS